MRTLKAMAIILILCCSLAASLPDDVYQARALIKLEMKDLKMGKPKIYRGIEDWALSTTTTAQAAIVMRANGEGG